MFASHDYEGEGYEYPVFADDMQVIAAMRDRSCKDWGSTLPVTRSHWGLYESSAHRAHGEGA